MTPLSLLLPLLAAAEIASALALAWINPVQGYDENWYLINSYRFQGTTTLPYAFYRPPMLPMLLALLGDYARLLSGLAHIGSTALVFLILRRIASPGIAIGGIIIFMASGDLRWFNVLMLTEMPSIFFLLLGIYLYVINRPALFGAAAALALMTHWGMATVGPVAVAVYLTQRRWHACGRFIGGSAAVLVPLLIGYTIAHGNPLAPFVYNLHMNSSPANSANDWWYYIREFPQVPVTLIAGGAVAIYWLIGARRSAREQYGGLCLLMLGIVFARLALLQVVTVKGVRFLVPLIPVLLLLSALMVRCYGGKRVVQWAVLLVVLISVLPGKRLYWHVHDLVNDPTAQIVKFKDQLEARSPSETVYTDFNDLAVMGHTGHPAVAVTGPGSWHHSIIARPTTTRDRVPDGALYLTWDPGDGEVLVASNATNRGTLRLVRWRTADSREQSALP